LLAAFVKAIEQLGDPAVRRVLWVSVGFSVLAFALVWTGVGYLLTRTTFFHVGWLDTVIDVLGGFAVLAVSWLLFPAVVSTTTGFFLEDVADVVERRHYPNLPPVRSQPLEEAFASEVKFFGVMLSLNLILLPFLLIPPVFPFVFYGINGYLLGREYFDLVAARRLDRIEARSLRRRHGRTLFIAGVLIALLLTIPLVNLVAPLVGTAAMVHLFETARRETWGAPVPGETRREPATRGDIE
jgi:CysZ protein